MRMPWLSCSSLSILLVCCVSVSPCCFTVFISFSDFFLSFFSFLLSFFFLFFPHQIGLDILSIYGTYTLITLSGANFSTEVGAQAKNKEVEEGGKMKTIHGDAERRSLHKHTHDDNRLAQLAPVQGGNMLFCPLAFLIFCNPVFIFLSYACFTQRYADLFLL